MLDAVHIWLFTSYHLRLW